jgi:hypothetical protein
MVCFGITRNHDEVCFEAVRGGHICHPGQPHGYLCDAD